MYIQEYDALMDNYMGGGTAMYPDGRPPSDNQPSTLMPGAWVYVDATSVAAGATKWTCAYCGQDNNADREKCHGCQAPRVRSE